MIGPDTSDVQIHPDDAQGYEDLRADRHRTLVAPEDDMWATFADLARPHALRIGARLVGRFSVDADGGLHGFHVVDDHEDRAADLLARVVDALPVRAAMASTVDPMFLTLALRTGGATETVALMYEHGSRAGAGETVVVRLATPHDHPAAVAFERAANGAPESFASPYLAERIDLRELYLVEDAGRIVATGELRVDTRTPGNAHLGLVVDADLRSRGLGSRLMRTLTDLCTTRGLTPVCSTEPTNAAAQAVIRRAGFRNRHGVFRVDLGTG